MGSLLHTPGRVRRGALLVLAFALTGCGKITDSLTNPTSGLVIQRFSATPNPVDSGSVVLLSWEVSGADSVEIAPGVGTVSAKGSRVIAPSRTTTYKLSARTGTSSASASVDVVVGGTAPSPTPRPSTFPTPEPSPTPSPSPSPSPSPIPSPSPSPTDSPSPSPSPSESPSPSPSPSPEVTCGTPATFPGHCSLTIAYPDTLPASQCVELTDIRTSNDCPVNFGVPLSLSFQITAETAADYTWRRVANSVDVVTPASGTVAKSGETNVTVSDLVLSDRITIEVFRGGDVVLRFTLKH